MEGNTLQAIDGSGLGVDISRGYTRGVPTVGSNIAHIRGVRGLNQTQLADALGIRPPSVHRMETSKALPKSETLLKIAVVLKCSVEDLLIGVDPAYEEMRKIDLPRHPPGVEPLVEEASRVSAAYRALQGRYNELREHVQAVQESLFALLTTYAPEAAAVSAARRKQASRHSRR